MALESQFWLLTPPHTSDTLTPQKVHATVSPSLVFREQIHNANTGFVHDFDHENLLIDEEACLQFMDAFSHQIQALCQRHALLFFAVIDNSKTEEGDGNEVSVANQGASKQPTPPSSDGP
jgi:hypothetical protein